MSMITAQALVSQALLLLEYRADEVSDDAALAVFNAVYRDVWCSACEGEYIPLTALQQPVSASEKVVDAVLYGVAAQLAQTVDDTEEQARYTAMYMRKRGRLPRPALQREDVLPGGAGHGN